MEKYGVKTDQKTKTASTEKGCPRCGAPVEEHGEVHKCTGDCGTEPFEQADGEENSND